MSLSIAKRPSLGQIAALGSLYDARTDTFIASSLFNKPLPSSVVETNTNHSIDIEISKEENYEEAFDKLGIDNVLGTSVLAGLVKIDGAARWLTEEHDTHQVIRSSLHHTMTTVDEEIILVGDEIKKFLTPGGIDPTVATHVVTAISWGARHIVSAKRKLDHEENKDQFSTELNFQLGLMRNALLHDANGAHISNKFDEHSGTPIEMTLFGDVMGNAVSPPRKIAELQDFLRDIPGIVSGVNNGKGQPLIYTLMPLPLLATFRILKLTAIVSIPQPSVECSKKYLQLFNDMRDTVPRLRDYFVRLQNHPMSVPLEHVKAIKRRLEIIMRDQTTLQSEYAQQLIDFRSGKSYPQNLLDPLEKFLDGVSSPKGAVDSMKYEDEMDFEDFLHRKGVRLVNYQSSLSSRILSENKEADVFILYFNNQIRAHSECWDENLTALLEAWK